MSSPTITYQASDAYSIDRIAAAEILGDTAVVTPFGASRLSWHHVPDRWCRYCGAKGHVWRSVGEDYYHGETTACTACHRVDCCFQEQM